MRPIDADKLMEWYANTPDCNIDDCHVSIPVIRQNIIDMPTVNPYEWISIEDRQPERYTKVLCYYKFEPESPDVICENTYYGRKHDGYLWLSDSSKVTHWMSLPAPPTEKEN